MFKYTGASNYCDEIDELVVPDVLNGDANCTAKGNKLGCMSTQSDVLRA